MDDTSKTPIRHTARVPIYALGQHVYADIDIRLVNEGGVRLPVKLTEIDRTIQGSVWYAVDQLKRHAVLVEYGK